MPCRYDWHMRKSADPVSTQEIVIDLLEKCPSCGHDDVLKVAVISGLDTARPSHRWCSGYGCTYTKDVLVG